MTVRTRPFASSTYAGGRERELLLDAFDSGQWSGFRAGVQGDARELRDVTSADAVDLDDLRFLGGKYVRKLEAMFAERTGCAFAIACNSATSGLVMAIGAIGIQPGDEVLVPCMSFHASATAIRSFGGVPVFVEVDPLTFNIDPIDAASRITARTRAIMIVHLGGIPADMDALLALAGQHGLRVIEDCAQAPGARYRGREVGSLGDAGVFSLVETKSITCGEGGVVVTNDPSIAFKCRLIRNHGEGAAQDDWSEEELRNVVGFNFRLTELQAAIAVAQCEQLDERNRLRNENARHIIDGLRRFPQFTPQQLAGDCEPAWFILKFRYGGDRDALIQALAKEGIPAVGGYTRLLHQHPLFAPQAARPRSEAINREFVWFSCIHPPNTREDMNDIIRAVEKVL
ncbi:MAG TPA: DegT/DnrJ/EryC1/StrS family aminotransferase [Thermoanaerobaculia bacterium]|jgi:dTDP-4-amino-4,6-dideoxygalactose transaminase